MPSDNPKISAYVPQSVYDCFKDFQKKQKLSMSQATIVIMSEYFGLEEILKGINPESPIGGVTLDEFIKLREEVQSLKKILNSIKSSEVNSVRQVLHKTKNKDTGIKENLVSKQPTIINIDKYTSCLEKNESLLKRISPISGRKLSSLRFFLGKTTVAVVKRAKNLKDFTKWTKEKDPDGIGWRSVETPKKGYLPLDDTPSELLDSLLEWMIKNGLAKPMND